VAGAIYDAKSGDGGCSGGARDGRPRHSKIRWARGGWIAASFACLAPRSVSPFSGLSQSGLLPGSLSNLVALLRHQLFVYRDLWGWLNAPFQGPPAVDEILACQLDLGFSR